MANGMPATNPDWQPVLSRLQSCAVDPHGAPRIISIKVLVRADGVPMAWSRPTVTVLEPKASALDLILGALGDGP